MAFARHLRRMATIVRSTARKAITKTPCTSTSSSGRTQTSPLDGLPSSRKTNAFGTAAPALAAPTNNQPATHSVIYLTFATKRDRILTGLIRSGAVENAAFDVSAEQYFDKKGVKSQKCSIV